MDMLNVLSTLKRWLRPRPAIQADYVLDRLIRDALLDEALVTPPPGAWERLRQTITERNMRNHGMWVLDEPLHEPREVPALLHGSQVNRALRLELITRSDSAWHIRDSAWGNLMPGFAAYVNW